MKIVATGHIKQMNPIDNEFVTVKFPFIGKVVDATHTLVAAKDMEGSINLSIKYLIAQQLKWGEKLYITVSTTPPEET